MKAEPTSKPAPRQASAAGIADPNRRSVLLGLGLAGGAAIATLAPGGAARAAENAAGCGQDTVNARQPFYGIHQAGVVTPRPAAASLAAFDVLATSRRDLQRLFQSLTERIEFLTQGGLAPTGDAKFPPPDSGLLGPTIAPDNLTMTVAVGASLFDDRFGLAPARPVHLARMPQFPNDALDASTCHGDLLLQICSGSAETNIHALRDVIKHHPDLLMLRWKQDGFLQTRGAARTTERNLLGFKDGTANPDASDDQAMNRLVWVQSASDEPAWATAGSYQVVRVIRQLVERWDRTALREQETIIGREKMTGAPLTMAGEHDTPDYAADPSGKRIPLAAHIRLANPRRPETEANLILRRPFNYARGATRAGQLDMGLLFVCFQADLAAGFATVQKRLNGEPLEEYIKPIGGGYFFVLPGAPGKGAYLGQSLIQSGTPGADDPSDNSSRKG